MRFAMDGERIRSPVIPYRRTGNRDKGRRHGPPDYPDRLRQYEHLKALLPGDLTHEEYEERVRDLAAVCGV